MKKLTYLFASLIMVALIVSCSKDATNDDVAMLKKAVVSTPVGPNSDAGVVPAIIPGANNGGNRTCAEVAAWKELPADYFYCGTKIDYNNGAFSGSFPAGLDVTVTGGKYVSFEMDNCIQFGDKFYKVGAVIVKGGNAANVYFYQNGSYGDSGLAAPINNGGQQAGLSNLTFCFVECEALPELVIVLKTYMQAPTGQVWAVTSGEGSDINSLRIGYVNYIYNAVNSYKIYYHGLTSMPVGTITATDYIDENDGIHYMDIVITANTEGWLFMASYLYVGTVTGYSSYLTDNSGVMYTNYGGFPFQEDELLATRTFKIPFSELTE